LSENPQLIYAVEYFIHKANPTGEYFNHTTFNKLLVELYLRLKERGLDIKLPYCWYKHGCLVDSISFQSATGISLMHYEPPRDSVIVMPSLPNPHNITFSEKTLIQEEIKKLLAEHPTRSYLKSDNREEYVNLNYKHAPLKFQKAFRRSLIPHLEYLKHLSQNISRSERWDLTFVSETEALYAGDMMVPRFSSGLDIEDQKKIIQQLDDLIIDFPRKEMRELYRTYLRWDDTFRLAVKHQDNLLKHAEDFWGIFAFLLRIKYNENITGERILEWQDDFERELSRYTKELKETRERLLELEAAEMSYDANTDRKLKKLMTISRGMALER